MNRWLEIIENIYEELPYEVWICYGNKDCNRKIAQFLHYETALMFGEDRVKDVTQSFMPEIKINLREKFTIKILHEEGQDALY